MIRKITANGIVASAIDGRIRWMHRVPGGVPLPGEDPVEHEEAGDPGGVDAGVCRPGHGQHPHFTAKTYLSRKARKNTGTATPISENTIELLSRAQPRRFAAM